MTMVRIAFLVGGLLLRLDSQSLPQKDSCRDDRDKLMDEYATYRIGMNLSCGSFTSEAHTEHFSFAQLNSGNYKWAVLGKNLLNGLECICKRRPKEQVNLNSGYRNPAHNATLKGAAPDSRHVHGDAADLASGPRTWQSISRDGKACQACVEPLRLIGNSASHVHVDWREKCPTSW